ncbi:endospore germination permease [Paenibacillaceae bacterium WGS1546]|uniref:GerAB/ArcD/ProY family transporter n=1 Tax=Cohnella sp. WGS1546 TaxID=3366810 RepID=UPI00372D34EE
MKYPRQITTIQAAAILVSTIIGVGVLPIPLFAVRGADSGAPLVTLLGAMVAFVGLFLVTKLGMRFPEKSIVQYAEDIIGKGLAFVGSLFVLGFFAVLTSLTAREFGEVVITAVLTKTPLEVTVIVMLTLAAISTRHDIVTFTYIHQLYFPLLIGPVVLIVALSLKNYDVINLQPVWGNEHQGMLSSVWTIAALFQGSFIITSVIPAMRRPEKAMKASISGIVIAGGLYVIIVAAAVSVFGAEETKNLLWPTLELAKATSLPANVLERLDAAFLAVWVTAVFTTLFSSYFLTVKELSKLCRLRDHKLFTFFLLPWVFTMAMVPENMFQMYEIIQNVGRIGLYITIAYPGLLLIIAMMRKKRGSSSEGRPAVKAD